MHRHANIGFNVCLKYLSGSSIKPISRYDHLVKYSYKIHGVWMKTFLKQPVFCLAIPHYLCGIDAPQSEFIPLSCRSSLNLTRITRITG